ncbi:MAG: SulP family inorganic anion transporter [Verrucomicrobiaceae bacterium]|nr:SulP family inorganic anion transporter [Verrucomicrobiaceae bacterium]
MFRLIYRKYGQGIRWKDDLLSGLTVALALVPEAVAFAFVAGVDPLVGLYAAFFVGLITSAIGGRPGMISGATGAMTVVMTSVVILFGLQYLLAAVVVAGIFQVLAGLLKLGRFIRILPHPVMLGFVNGLAIVIGLAQFGQFKTNHRIIYEEGMGFVTQGDWMNFSSTTLQVTLGIILLTMLISHFLPRFTRAIPAPLVAIVLGTCLIQFTPLETITVANVVDTQRALQLEKQIKTKEFEAVQDDLLVKDVARRANEVAARELTADEQTRIDELPKGLKAGLPTFAIPKIDLGNSEAVSAVIFLALALASIGLVESLMTLSLIDELTETRGSTRRECVGQGFANIVTGFFGGMGGCAMIGQSMININSGGRGRLSGISAAVLLLGFIMSAPKLIEMIPMGCLIGVMFMVVIATFEWSSFRLIGKVPATDLWVIFIVSMVTVFFHNLALAVGIGIVISTITYAWERSKDIELDLFEDKDNERHYKLRGTLFFGSIQQFKDLFNPTADPDDVYISFRRSKVCDHSAIEAIHSVSEKYRALGKRLHLTHLDAGCSKVLEKAGDLVEAQYYAKVSGGH